jgi:hypothetical protein
MADENTTHLAAQALIKAQQDWLAPVTEKLLAFQKEFHLSDDELTQRFSRESTRKVVDGHFEITLTIYYNCGKCTDPRAHKFAESTLIYG